MQFPSYKYAFLSFLFFFISSTMTHGQSTIQDQFDEFYEKQTSTWQEYKLVKMPRLKTFWKVVADTIKTKEDKINTAYTEIQSLNVQLSDINGQLKDAQASLAASEALNDSISFLGIPMAKSVYNLFVWLIIVGLIIGIVSIYLLYLRNNKITRQARKNLAKVEEEYTAHQERAREKQTKLKRELQTALNTLQEHRIKV